MIPNWIKLHCLWMPVIYASYVFLHFPVLIAGCNFSLHLLIKAFSFRIAFSILRSPAFCLPNICGRAWQYMAISSLQHATKPTASLPPVDETSIAAASTDVTSLPYSFVICGRADITWAAKCCTSEICHVKTAWLWWTPVVNTFNFAVKFNL